MIATVFLIAAFVLFAAMAISGFVAEEAPQALVRIRRR